MNETKKMLRAIINGQSLLRDEFLSEIKKLRGEINDVKKEMREGFKKVNKRMDKIGSQLAYLEDLPAMLAAQLLQAGDVPTIKEHEKLEKRVTVIEHNIA